MTVAQRELGPLGPQDLILSILGSYVREPGQVVWSGGLVELLGELGFGVPAARVALGRLVGRDLIARVRRGRFVYYRLTPRSESLLKEGDARIFTFGRGSLEPGPWTVIWHAIPEEQRIQRARLANRLRFLGFGTMQSGTWISPHDHEDEVTELLRSLQVTEHAGVMLGCPAASLDFGGLVARAWDLPALAAGYRAFIDAFAGWANAMPALDREAFLVRTQMTHAFRAFPSADPELSDQLMPEVAPLRTEAVRIFHSAYGRLAPAATSWFGAVTAPETASAPA